jgi:protein TonB
MSVVTITANDRLALTVFVALALHVIAIFGVAIDRINEQTVRSSSRITIAIRNDNQPVDADFKAQFNQQGSGESQDVLELSAPVPAVVAEIGDAADLINGSTQEAPIDSLRSWNVASQILIRAISPRSEPTSVQDAHNGAGSLASQISLIEARLNEIRQSAARRPRVRTLTSIAAQAADDAEYLEQWRQRVEQIGNANYPQEAVKNNLFGDVRLKVSVRANGSVSDIQVLKSSGYRLLDRTAVDTVRKAEPFAPFPASIRDDTDQLDIIRTWRFEPTGRIQTK